MFSQTHDRGTSARFDEAPHDARGDNREGDAQRERSRELLKTQKVGDEDLRADEHQDDRERRFDTAAPMN